MTNIDYWSKLKLDECWSKQQKYNIIMNYIMDETNGEPKTEQEEVQLSNVSVTVVDEENNPINNATVTIHNTDTPVYEGITGTAGGCNIKNIPYGEYIIDAITDGYVKSEKNITVNTKDMEVEIVLSVQQSFQIDSPTFEETEENEF